MLKSRFSFLLLLVFFQTFVHVNSQSCTKLLRRREWRTTTRQQRIDYTSAVKLLMVRKPNNGPSVMDEYSRMHYELDPQIHRDAVFLPWHRQFVRQYELKLQEVSKNTEIFVPYWNTLYDSQALEASPLFGDKEHHLGPLGNQGNGFCINSGVFKDYRPLTPNEHCLKRVGATARLVMPASDVLVTDLNKMNTFEDIARSLEDTVHAYPHILIGGYFNNIFDGDMAQMYSPNDPIFYLHHCHIDKLWALWQKGNPSRLRLYGGDKRRGGKAVDTEILPGYNNNVKSVLNTLDLCYDYDDFNTRDIVDVNLPPPTPPVTTSIKPTSTSSSATPTSSAKSSTSSAKSSTSSAKSSTSSAKSSTSSAPRPTTSSAKPTTTSTKPTTTTSSAPVPTNVIKLPGQFYPVNFWIAGASRFIPISQIRLNRRALPDMPSGSGSNLSNNSTNNAGQNSTGSADPIAVAAATDVTVKPVLASAPATPKTDDVGNLLALRSFPPIPDYWIKLNGLNATAVKEAVDRLLTVTEQLNKIEGYVSPCALWNRADLLVKIVQEKKVDTFYAVVNNTKVEVKVDPSDPLQAISNVYDRVSGSFENDVAKPIEEVRSKVEKILGPPVFGEESACSPYVTRKKFGASMGARKRGSNPYTRRPENDNPYKKGERFEAPMPQVKPSDSPYDNKPNGKGNDKDKENPYENDSKDDKPSGNPYEKPNGKGPVNVYENDSKDDKPSGNPYEKPNGKGPVNVYENSRKGKGGKGRR